MRARPWWSRLSVEQHLAHAATDLGWAAQALLAGPKAREQLGNKTERVVRRVLSETQERLGYVAQLLSDKT